MIRLGKLAGQGSLLLMGLLMVGVSVVKVRAEGDGRVGEANGNVPMTESVVVVKEEVNYYLPYPGMLPDHPLYWVKMVRDKLREYVLFRLERKVEYWAFLADKRIGAGKVLMEGGKGEKGVVTYRKASGYLKKAVTGVEELVSEGVETGALTNKIEQATLKYIEVLERSAARNESLRGQIEEVKKEVEESRQRILIVLGRV